MLRRKNIRRVLVYWLLRCRDKHRTSFDLANPNYSRHQRSLSLWVFESSHDTNNFAVCVFSHLFRVLLFDPLWSKQRGRWYAIFWQTPRTHSTAVRFSCITLWLCTQPNKQRPAKKDLKPIFWLPGGARSLLSFGWHHTIFTKAISLLFHAQWSKCGWMAEWKNCEQKTTEQRQQRIYQPPITDTLYYVFGTSENTIKIPYFYDLCDINIHSSGRGIDNSVCTMAVAARPQSQHCCMANCAEQAQNKANATSFPWYSGAHFSAPK